MADQPQPTPTENAADKRSYSAAYPIAVAFLAVIFFLIVGMALYPNGEHAWGYGINLFTSIISTVATVGIIEVFNRQREQREAAEREESNRRRDAANAELARKQQLIDDTASNVNDVAKNAVYQMRRKEWLMGENGLLKGADLRRANLQGADLGAANLQEANLIRANLQEADLHLAYLQGAGLMEANLQEANLIWANLQEANLIRAYLQGAGLMEANLQGANLRRANLQGADLGAANLQAAYLRLANLQGANLFRAKFDEHTTLPDGSQWTPETNLRRFTDPDYPDFWRSPSYWGRNEA